MKLGRTVTYKGKKLVLKAEITVPTPPYIMYVIGKPNDTIENCKTVRREEFKI